MTNDQKELRYMWNLLTKEAIDDYLKKIRIVALLNRGKTYREIEEETKTSSGTISKVNKIRKENPYLFEDTGMMKAKKPTKKETKELEKAGYELLTKEQEDYAYKMLFGDK